MKKFFALPAIALAAMSVAACTEGPATGETSVEAGEAKPITEAEVTEAQKAWGDGILAIGKAYADEGDFKAAAEKHLNDYYAYDDAGSTVLFKPTLTSEDQFRGTFAEALNYFIGLKDSEDTGFAIKPWTSVRFENEGTIIDSDSAVAMGNYYFGNPDGEDTKVEYTFGYVRGADGKLKINLHHSSLPYDPD